MIKKETAAKTIYHFQRKRKNADHSLFKTIKKYLSYEEETSRWFYSERDWLYVVLKDGTCYTDRPYD